MQDGVRTGGSIRTALSLRKGLVLAAAAAGTACAPIGALPASPGVQEPPSTPWQASIEDHEVCVGSSVASAGELADVLYYRASVLADGKLVVGYFAFFSDERPWGNNWLTWTVLPAVAVDLVYSRALFVAPGLQRALHGKGDVEGFRVYYDPRPDGTLGLDRAEADDGTHQDVHLAASDILALDPQRPTFYSNVWSHQLGGRGLHKMSELKYVRCFGHGRIRPLPDKLVKDFALQRRARPAHVEALGGHGLDVPPPTESKARPVTPRL